jgi:hypothetical protein
MFKSACLLLAMSSTAYARPDGTTMMREVYANMWKTAILNMFADAGPTRVELVKNTLLIANPNCDTQEVKAALAETFGTPAIKEKLKEINMKVRCDSGILASR